MIGRFRPGPSSSNTSTNGTHADKAAEGENATPADSQVSRRELRQLKWLTALVPFTVVLIYEAARREALEHILPALPVEYGNLIVWVLVLLLTYGFATFVSVSWSDFRHRRWLAVERWLLSTRFSKNVLA
jgi:hypothetical protein